ncbi:MAG: metalloregulator ArsR/SmtB family transcription factor [Candidatus Sungiibacteriota bacterium]
MKDSKNIQRLERMLKCLANRRRLAILRYIREEKEATVNDIADEIRLSFKATSKHLCVLANVDILEREQRSKYMIYRLAEELHPVVRHTLSLV